MQSDLREEYKQNNFVEINNSFDKQNLLALSDDCTNFAINNKSFNTYQFVYKNDWKKTNISLEGNRIINKLMSKGYIEDLEEITGIQGLIPDNRLEQSYLNQIPDKGFISTHSDKNFQFKTRLFPALNLIIFFDGSCFAGQLFLKNEKLETLACIKSEFNKTVIFPSKLNMPYSFKYGCQSFFNFKYFTTVNNYDNQGYNSYKTHGDLWERDGSLQQELDKEPERIKNKELIEGFKNSLNVVNKQFEGK